MGRRMNGEGSWGKKVVNGIDYTVLTKSYNGKRKSFYGKTKTEVNKKMKEYELKNKLIPEQDNQKMDFYNYSYNWLFNWRKRI